MYYDAVVDEDYQPVYNQPKEYVVSFLRDNPLKLTLGKLQVCDGQTLRFYSVAEYLREFDK